MTTGRLPAITVFLSIAGLAGCSGSAASPAQFPADTDKPVEVATPMALPTNTPAPTEDTGPWKVALKTERIKFAATVVGFLDESLGFTAGYAGEVHYTADGGKTWPAGANSSACRFGMDILDQQRAWTIGNGGDVRFTRDGGQTWEALADVPTGLSHLISMADEQTGWAANFSRMVATADGGKTWTDVALPAGLKGLAAIHLRTAGEGYAVGGDGALYATGDGGKTWNANSLGMEGKITAPKDLPFAAVRFLDPDHGVVILKLEQGDGTLFALRTADGGATWTRETLPEKAGVLFLTRDARYLTIFKGNNTVVVLRYQP